MHGEKINSRSKRNRSRRNEPSLAKIVLGIIVLGGTVLGVLRFSDWFNTEYVVGEVKATAAEDLNRARALIEEGKIAEAEKVLGPIIARVDDPSLTPTALLLQAELDRNAGDTDAALEHLRQAAEDYPGGPEQSEALVRYASLLEETGQADTALQVYARIRDTAPPKWRAAALNAFASQTLAKGDKEEARTQYRQALDDAEWGSDIWMRAAEAYGALNVELIFSSARTDGSKVYTVKSGDSLTNIGIALNTTQGMLMQANGMTDPNRLHPGQSLKYTPKDFRIVIERETCRLFLLDGDGLFKVYGVGLGKDHHETALGQYRIGNKEKDPTWFKPGSEPIPSGDPRNELGTRWMPLVPEVEGLPSDLGIHGTIRPESIGKYESLGCPRMVNDQVEELYGLVVRATPVSVVDRFQPLGLDG